jgi:hypothetical protein
MAYVGCADVRFAIENGGTFQWQAAGNLTDWDVTDLIIIALAWMEISDHSPDATTHTLQWRNITDSGSWTTLAATGEMKIATTTGYADGDLVSDAEQKCSGCAAATNGFITADSYKDENGSESGTLGAKFNWSEGWWCVDPADAPANKEYEFRIYDSDTAAGLVPETNYTLKTAGPVDLNIDIDTEEAVVTVTDVPTVSLPDALTISVFDGSTVTDAVTDMAQELVPNVFDGVTVADVPEMAQESFPSVFDSVTVADVPALAFESFLSVFDTTGVTEYVELAQELVPSVFDGVTVLEDVTVSLPDALEMSVQDTTTVTDEETVVVQDAAAEDLDINVFDTVTVTDAVDFVEVSQIYWTDFMEYTTAQFPSDWTARYHAGRNTVETGVHKIGGKIWQYADAGGGWLYAGSPDDLDDFRNGEILILARFTTNAGGQILSFRGAGTLEGGDEYGYIPGRSTTNNITLGRMIDGSWTWINTGAGSWAYNVWQKLKAWTYGSAEPGGWDIEESDTGITAAGWAGICCSYENMEIDFISIATGGDSAPLPVVPDVSDNVTVVDVETVEFEVSELAIDVYDDVTVEDVPKMWDPNFRTCVITQDSLTTTGDQDFTEPGFGTPKAAIIIATSAESDDVVNDNVLLSIGFTDGTRQVAMKGTGDHNVGTTNTNQRTSEVEVAILYTKNLSENTWVQFKEWTEDGVTLTYNPNSLTDSVRITVVLLAGDDLSAYADYLNAHDSVNQSVTETTGFRADAIITIGMVLNPNRGNYTHNRGPALGFCLGDAALTQKCTTYSWGDADASGNSTLMLETGRSAKYVVDGGEESSIEITAIDDTGFTVTTRDSGAVNHNYHYLALKIDNKDFWMDYVDSPTSTGEKAVTLPGFKPEFLLQLLTMAPATDTLYYNANAGAFGVSVVNERSERSLCIADEFGADPTNTQDFTSESSIILYGDDGTLEFDATFVSFNINGWTLNYTTADGTVRKWLALAIGEGVSPEVYDSVTVTDAPTVEVITPGVYIISEFDTTAVTESVTVSLPDALEISISEPVITVTDVPTVAAPFAVPKDISEFDETSVTESVKVELDLLISVFDTTAVTESVDLAKWLTISVFDGATVTDVDTVVVTEAGVVQISVFDTVTVGEYVDLAQELVLSVFDTVTVTESVDLAQELVPSVFDTVTVVDVVDDILVTEGLLEVSVFDTITVGEFVDLAKELTVLVFDTTGVTEYVELAKELTVSVFDGTAVTDVETVELVSLELSANVFDEVTVSEAVTVSLPDALLVNVFDGVTAVDVETVEVGAVEFYNVSVYDETTVTDSVAATLPDALAITVSDTITVGEFTDLQFLNYFVSVFDTVTVTELVEVAPQLKIDVFDTTAVTDSVSITLADLEAVVFDTVSVADVVGFFIPNFGINVFETVAVTESTAGIVGTVILSTFDTVTVTEDVDLYWIVSKGVARMEATERAPDIEFAARAPRIDYLVRS